MDIVKTYFKEHKIGITYQNATEYKKVRRVMGHRKFEEPLNRPGIMTFYREKLSDKAYSTFRASTMIEYFGEKVRITAQDFLRLMDNKNKFYL